MGGPVSRIDEAKRRLREAAEAAEPEHHVAELVREVPWTMFALGLGVGVAVGVAAMTTGPVRRRLLRTVLRIEDAYPGRSGAPERLPALRSRP